MKPLDKEKIPEQQQAVKEIRSKINWWQQFQAFGINEKITLDSERKINKWLVQENKIFTNAKWKLLLYVYPVITLTCVYLFLDDVLSTGFFSLLVLIFFMIGLAISGKIQRHIYFIIEA